MRATLKLVKEFGAQTEDPLVRKKIEELDGLARENFKKAFLLALTCIQAAKKVGNEAWMDAHALLYVLQPTNYGIAQKFLQNKYGQKFKKAQERTSVLLTEL
jgi:hypothetical protein